MLLVIPCRDGCCLHGRAHRAAVVSTIQQEFFQNVRITRNEPRAHAWHIGTLRQAGKRDQVAVAAANQLLRGLQRAERSFGIEIDFGITLVGVNDEAVPV